MASIRPEHRKGAERRGNTRMTASVPPGNVFAPEQWRLIEDLSRSLTPMQAQWLSGYFAGIDAGMRSPLPLPASSSPTPASACSTW